MNLIAVGDAPKKTRVQSPNNRERVPIMLNVGEVAGDWYVCVSALTRTHTNFQECFICEKSKKNSLLMLYLTVETRPPIATVFKP